VALFDKDKQFLRSVDSSILISSLNIIIAFLAGILIVFSKPIVDIFAEFNRLGKARIYSRFQYPHPEQQDTYQRLLREATGVPQDMKNSVLYR